MLIRPKLSTGIAKNGPPNLFAGSKTEGCSISEARIGEFSKERMTVLFDSLPPEVKIISSGEQFKREATCSLAVSKRFFEKTPAE